MPVINTNANKPTSSTGNQGRTVFRPPWVREGPSPLPMPSNMPTMTPSSWASKSNNVKALPSENSTSAQTTKPVLRKQTKITIPIEPINSSQNSSRVSEKTIPIRVESTKTSSQPTTRSEKVIPIRTESTKNAQPVSRPTPQPEIQQPSWRRTKNSQPAPGTKDKMPPTASKPPPSPASGANPPPPPPMAPPPPPMLGDGGDLESKPPINKQPLTKERLAKLDALRSRPRKRPDWTDMMKEVESGKKLKHVQCNDRSAPVLPGQKAKGQFVYESEQKDDDKDRNKLLKQIQGGIRLKKVKTNDRSKPNLDGLRKFRREMTIEEQIQKSISMADVVAAAVDPDELDDIDKVRDDLQSAKQMLALELRNKEAIERENKRLLARLANLEAELEKEKVTRASGDKNSRQVRTEEDEKLISSLKEEAAEANRTAKDMEHKYHSTAEQLDNMRRKLESAWLQNQELEQQLKSVSQGTPMNQLMRQPSKKFIPIANGGSVDLISDDEEEESETETEEVESDTEGAGGQEKQTARELKLLTAKLKTFREKQAASLKERRLLRDQLKKRQNELKEEKKKYKILQKEVDKMAKLMREHEGEDMEEDDDDNAEEHTDTESESEESEEETQSDEEIPATATAEEKRKLLLERTKRHENRLASLKKGNNLMKANIERLQDDINRQQENAITLQEDLDNLLADLG